MLEVLGGRAENQQGQPLALPIGGHVAEPLADGPDALEIMMLIQKAVEPPHFFGLDQADLAFIEQGLLIGFGQAIWFMHAGTLKSSDPFVPQKVIIA